MDLVRTPGCFVCGENNETGIGARFMAIPGMLCSFARLSLVDRFQGWDSIVHGGIIAALLDEACIYAALGTGKKAVTAELTTRYRKPVPCGQEVSLFGEVVMYRRQIARARARLVLGGEVCAEADARLFLGIGGE
jgi:uncharacterized protein (TIGR00369 family)